MAGENNAADLPVRLPDPVRYSSLSPIGEGGMGLVYRARDTTLARDVAIKTLRTYAPDEVYQQELAELRDALDATRNDGLVTVCISGPSGIGKTTLVERFVAATARATPDAVLLEARCHPQESIPFKAVDGAIDDLTRFLSHQPDARVEALLPRDIAALARVFPVLGRVKAIAAATEHAESSPEPQEIRR